MNLSIFGLICALVAIYCASLLVLAFLWQLVLLAWFILTFTWPLALILGAWGWWVVHEWKRQP